MTQKVVICSSLSFWDDIVLYKEKLEKDGYSVIKHPEKLTGDFLPAYKEAFTNHYKKIVETDVLFILNNNKNSIDGYIGPAVFAEIAFAVGLNRSHGKNIKVYCLNKFSENLPYYEELKYWLDLGWIDFWKD